MVKGTRAGAKSAIVGANSSGSVDPQPKSPLATSPATSGINAANGSTSASAVRSVEETVRPTARRSPSWASAEMRGRMAVASETVTMECGTIISSRPEE